MGLQTEDLVMVALSIVDDQPPNSIQPELTDGIHLRWAFNQARGFPWYGYYLFRRPHSLGDLERTVIKIDSLTIQPGATTSTSCGGVWSSDSSLRLSTFPPGTTTYTGLDLSGSSFIRLILPTHVSEIVVRIGFLTQAE